MCVCECACLHTRMHTPICLFKENLPHDSIMKLHKEKRSWYLNILKSRPPQTIGATGQWTKGNRPLEIPRPAWIWRCDRTRGPQWSRAWRTDLNRKDKSQEVMNESPKEAEDSSRVNTPKLEGGKYWRGRGAHETGNEAAGAEADSQVLVLDLPHKIGDLQKEGPG